MQQLTLTIEPAPPARVPLPVYPYVVALRDSDLDAVARMRAEARFCKALEDRLGMPAEVAQLLHQLQSAEAEGRALTPDEQTLAKRWQMAHAVARSTGLQDLAQMSDAWFEIVLS